jgi:hypothetical protein
MKPKQLPMEELQQCYMIDPDTPSGLSRIGSPGRKKGKLGPTGGVGSDGYWRVKHRGENYRIHRIIWALHHGQDPGHLVVDHWDRNPLNNQIENLRACTTAQNLQNKKSPGRRITSGLPKNVVANGDSYQVKIMTEGQLVVTNWLSLEEATLAGLSDFLCAGR